MALRTWLSVGLLVVLAPLTAAACGSSGADVCSAKCDCERCSDADFNRCADDADREERDAEDRGCAESYQRMIDCQDSTSSCFDGHFDTNCHDSEDAYHHCKDDKKH